MIDVFICSAPLTEERYEMAVQTIKAWKEDKDANLVLLQPFGAKEVSDLPCIEICSPPAFQFGRRVYANWLTRTDPYIVADDDCIPLTPLSGIREAWDRHPKYGTLSYLPINANIIPWEGGEVSDEITEHVSTGGIRVSRKLPPLEWPEPQGPQYDRIHADFLRGMGLKVGYLNKWKMFHLGEGKSTLQCHENS